MFSRPYIVNYHVMSYELRRAELMSKTGVILSLYDHHYL